MKLKTTILLILILLSTFAQNQQEQPAEETQSKEISQKSKIPVSDSIIVPVLDFKNTDIRDILRAVGMQYNVNIYLEPDVSGEISLYLVDIPVKDAIEFIVKRKGYDYTVKNNIVKVFKPKEEPPPPPPKPKVVFHKEGDLLTVDIKDIPAEDVVRLFIDSANINVVLDGKSDKKLSSRLSKIETEKAIRIIFQSNGFDVNVSDDVYYVAQQTWADDKGAQTGAQRPRRMNIKVTPDKKVSLEVNDAPIDDVIRNIAIESGLNIIVYDKVTGSISAKCDTTYIDDVLRFMLQNTQFTFWKDKGIYFIGSREMSQQKTTEIIPLKHIRAEEADISKFLPPKISKDAVIKYDSEHNSVIVIGSFDIVAQAKDFFENIDKPIPQVLIEALVVEFNLSKIRSYGVSVFTGGLGDTSADWQSEQFLPTINVKPGRKRTALILNDVLKHLGAKRVVELPKNFRASIQALETADVVKVHSTPQIATINGNAASITIGETRYYKLSKETISTTSNVQQNLIGMDERFEEKKFNTVLEVTPWVMADGYVMVDIRPEFNIPRSGGSEDRPPTIDTRVIKSMVRLRDGQTIVLGGQRQSEDVVNSKGIPFLSSIPVLGYLFSSKTVSKNETQMMIFLTPHVYYGDEGVVSPDDYFGDELNKMLEKHDPELKRERREEKRNLRKQKREEREKERELQDKAPLNQLQAGKEPVKKESAVKGEKETDSSKVQKEKENKNLFKLLKERMNKRKEARKAEEKKEADKQKIPDKKEEAEKEKVTEEKKAPEEKKAIETKPEKKKEVPKEEKPIGKEPEEKKIEKKEEIIDEEIDG